MTVQFKLRRGTADQWSTANPVLAQGEPGYVTDTEVLKIGNGVDAWNDLPSVTEAAIESIDADAGSAFRVQQDARNILRDVVTADVYGIVADGLVDDTDAFETLITTTIPDYTKQWGPKNGFDTDGIPIITLPPGSVLRLTRQIAIPEAKAFHLWTPAKGGARILYEGTQKRTNGATTAGSKTLTGTGFTADDLFVEIAIRGAGDGGSTLVTWIQSYTNSTTVELAHEASTTIASGATYLLRFSAFRKGIGRSSANRIPYTFENLVFDGGGLCFSNTTKPIKVQSCSFHDTQGPAVLALNKPLTVGADADTGTGACTYHVDDAVFNHCYGGYWHLAATASLSSVTHSRHNASRDISMVMSAGFHHLQQIDFQGMEATIGNTMPHIWLPSDIEAGGRSRWDDLRFGAEIFTEGPEEPGSQATFEPAFTGIVIGPLSGPAIGPNAVSAATTRPEELRIGRIWFGGHPTPTSTSADSAIVINKAIHGFSIETGKFGLHNGALIRENWLNGIGGVSGTTREAISGRNWFDPSIAISDSHRGGVFSHGGADWQPQPIAQAWASTDETRRRQNLLPRSNSLGSVTWTRTSVTAAQDTTGPDEVTNTGWTITRNSAASVTAGISQVITSGFVVGGSVTYSVYLKAGTHNKASLSVLATDISGSTQELANNLKPIDLTSRWERYVVVCPYVPSTTGIEVKIVHGVGKEVAPDGTTILAAYPQLERGLAATEYMDNPGTTLVEPLPFQSLSLGKSSISYGTAAPTTGRHEVGEIVFNTVPVAGGFIGWTCVAAGTPGTWKTFGVISA